MTGNNKHITILILGIFIFPVAFQPFHVFLHHFQINQENYLCCKTACLNHPDEEEPLTYLIQTDHCPICEYEFPVRDLTAISVYKPGIPFITESDDAGLTASPYKRLIATDIPRAPPYLG